LLTCFLYAVGDFASAQQAYEGTLVGSAGEHGADACWERLGTALGYDVLAQGQRWLTGKDQSLPCDVRGPWPQNNFLVWPARQYGAIEAFSAYGGRDSRTPPSQPA
jgi:hypothetical protein